MTGKDSPLSANWPVLQKMFAELFERDLDAYTSRSLLVEDIGLDDLDLLEMMMTMEMSIEGDIDEDAWHNCRTLGELAKHVATLTFKPD